MSDVVMLADPEASNATVMSCATATGSMLSTTVTVAVASCVFPLPSVAVNVTTFAPRSSQSNEVISSDNVYVQLSLLPLSMSDVVMLADPEASNATVMSCATATGSMLSTTVTVAVASCVFPLPSVAVNVTTFAPRSSQSNEVISSDNVYVQLSLLPLSMSDVVMLADPEASNATVMSCATATGSMLSTTVTVAVASCVFPLPSVAVNVTTFAPKFSKANDLTPINNIN